MEESLAAKKALLLWLGDVRLEPRDGLQRTFSRSTAGPGAGGRAIAFGFNGARVKLHVSDDPATPVVFTSDNKLSIFGQGAIAEKVGIAPILLHCPGQAFVNLTPRCMFSCAFCTTPQTPDRLAAKISDDTLFEAVMAASADPAFESVAITSGVTGSVNDTLKRVDKFVARVRAALPDAPIGVEPYVDDPMWVDALRESGANEIKLNIETATPKLFDLVCPEREREDVIESLGRAVEVFGRGKVTSNIIFGLGETDEQALDCYRNLANIGVVPNLRALRVSEANCKGLAEALGREPEPPEPRRVVSLACEARKILEERGLTTLKFKTMCFPCQCCDIVPFRDV
jgi:hypothetical protein